MARELAKTLAGVTRGKDEAGSRSSVLMLDCVMPAFRLTFGEAHCDLTMRLSGLVPRDLSVTVTAANGDIVFEGLVDDGDRETAFEVSMTQLNKEEQPYRVSMTTALTICQLPEFECEFDSFQYFFLYFQSIPLMH